MTSSSASFPAPIHAHRSRLSLAVALALASTGAAVHAQAATPAAGAASQPTTATAAEETQSVTITATRRREPAREVPMQVDVLSAQQLDNSGAKTLQEYLGAQPGVDVKTDGGAGRGAISIRGVSSGDQTISTVSTYIDDVSVGSSSAYLKGSTTALDMALLDLNHIELLRGPQGTLYGAGAMGGLLKYVTNEPDTSELSGKVGLGFSHAQGGGWDRTVSGVVNVPLKEDVAAFRVAAFRQHDGGFIDSVGPDAKKDSDRGDSTGARLSLLVEPSARLHVRVTALTQDIHRDGQDTVDYDATTRRPVTGAAQRTLFVDQPYSTKVNVASADIEYDFGWARLNSISSVQQTKLQEHVDLTGVYDPLLGNGFSTVPEDAYATVHKETQEFRLTSKSGEAVEWLAGLYYDREHGDNGQNVIGTVTGSPDAELASILLPSKYQELAAYGDVTWNPTPSLALTGGLRFAQNKQSFAQISDGPLAGGASDTPGSSEDKSTTYLGTARYALTSTSNVYFRAASGYRPGGPNAVGPRSVDSTQPAAPLTFKHDSLWSYEAGYKADLFDKTLSIESAVYDIEWKDIQQFFTVGGIGVIVNGGKAQVQGVEFGATWHALPNWNLTGNLAANDARLTQDAPGLAASGSRLPNTSRISGSVLSNTTFSLAGHSAYAGLTERFVGERNAGFAGSQTLPNYKLPAYWLTDVSSGVDFSRFTLGLYVRNVFNRNAQVGASTSFVPLGGPVEVTPARPRTAGMQLTANF